MFRKLLLVGAALVVAPLAAQAADLTEPPTVYDWTGPYIGLQGGYAWGSNDADIKEVSAPPPTLAPLIQKIPEPLDVNTIDIDGWVGGIHAGYLWQSDSLVLGVEGDGEFADIDGDTHIGSPIGSVGRLEQEIDWLASLRLRAGFAADRALFYATGGLAVGGVELTSDSVFTALDSSNKETEWGWTAGGGIDYAFTDDLSGRIEYRYTDLGDIDTSAGDGTPKFKADTAFHAVRVGLSWHFGR